MQHPRFKAASASLGHNVFIVGGIKHEGYQGEQFKISYTTEIIHDGVSFHQKNERKATHGNSLWHSFGPHPIFPIDSHCMVNFQGISNPNYWPAQCKTKWKTKSECSEKHNHLPYLRRKTTMTNKTCATCSNC